MADRCRQARLSGPAPAARRSRPGPRGLTGYFRLLDDLGDLPWMTACALDTARHDRMLDLTGGDAALTECSASPSRRS